MFKYKYIISLYKQFHLSVIALLLEYNHKYYFNIKVYTNIFFDLYDL